MFNLEKLKIQVLFREIWDEIGDNYKGWWFSYFISLFDKYLNIEKSKTL